MTFPSPLFVVIEPSGAAAREPARRVAWACAGGAGVADAQGFAEAARAIAELARTHPLHLADPLFDAPRLAALFADAGLAPSPEGKDWLLALAPFGQARNLAGILDAAGERADPGNPAARLFEAWREAEARARGPKKPAKRQPKR
jgi:hypothetical protein